MKCTLPLRRSAAVATLSAVALLLTACSGSVDTGSGGGGDAPAAAEGVTQEQIDEAMTTPTDLVFWTWVPDVQNEVDLFEEAYPDISVEVVNVGQGAPHYQKLRAAIQAGQGAPDVAQVEYQHLASFDLGGDLEDLAPYGMADNEGLYPEWVWNQVADGDRVLGVPQDVGPMGLLYREDVLTANGLEPPATWDAFAEAARTVHAANPEQYLVDMPGNDPGQFMGLLWQAGAKPFDFDGDQTVTIDLDTPEVAQVVDYWDGLIQEGVVATDPDFNDAWYQGLASGKYVSWPTAAWGPVFLQGTAGDTSGLWRAAPMPQWEEGAEVSGNWGGSTDAVLSGSENKIAASQLAIWLNTDEESSLKMATEQFLFPPLTSTLEDPAFAEQEPEFYGGQRVNELFTAQADLVDKDFGWLPFTDYAYSSFEQTLGTAISDRTDLSAGLAAWEADITQYATDQGFTVE